MTPSRLLAFVGLLLIVAAMLLLSSTAVAEKKNAEEPPEPPPANLLFVNAVQDKGLAFLVVDGYDSQPDGFRSGMATGWFQFESGSRVVQVEHQPLGIVDLELDLEPNSHHAIIVHNFVKSQKDVGRPPRPTIEVLVLPCQLMTTESQGDMKDTTKTKKKKSARQLTVVNVSRRDSVRLLVAADEINARRFKSVAIEIPTGEGFAPVRLLPDTAIKREQPGSKDGVEKEEVPEPVLTLNLMDRSQHFLILFDDESGSELRTVGFQLSDADIEDGSGL